jgi:hypothetical protein
MRSLEEFTIPPKREVIAVFDHLDQLNAAINELEYSSVPKEDISILDVTIKDHNGQITIEENFVSNQSHNETLVLKPIEGTVGYGFILACGLYFGALLALIMHGADTTSLLPIVLFMSFGALMGLAATILIYEIYKQASAYLSSRTPKQNEQGMIWVRTPDPHLERTVIMILKKNGGKAVHVHNR